MITHANLLSNLEMLYVAFQMASDSVWVGWLPHFHDMGLIGLLLQPCYAGIPSIFMAPFAFMRKPIRWLQAISDHHGTIAGAPNFAYDLCVRKVVPEQKESLDLSSWTVAFNGAEPVRTETLSRFTNAFADCGFRAEAFYPCYGLAEATLFVTGGTVKHTPKVTKADALALKQNRFIAVSTDQPTPTSDLVSCGQPWLSLRLVIVNPDTHEFCPDGEIGEIWLAGPSVAQGYWNQPQTTGSIFQAHLKNAETEQEGSIPFLRTGDLGVIHAGELFVTGRLKELIVIRGHNHYPQDIEWTVGNSHSLLKPGCGAAFTIDEAGEEQLVVVQEVKGDFDERCDTNEVIGNIREALAVQHELRAWALVLVRSGTISKTSSGKIQRNMCRHQFLDSTFGDRIKCIS